jgi:hypothetical protein
VKWRSRQEGRHKSDRRVRHASMKGRALACVLLKFLWETGGSGMPEKQTVRRAANDKRRGKAPSTQAGEFVREEIHHVREGKHGARSTKQAIAIGLSKARRAGVKLPPPRGAKASTKRSARHASRAAGRRTQPSMRRARGARRALRREPRRAASRKALARQARSAARRRSAAARSSASRRAARTKGPRVRRAAARKAARTRHRRAVA